MARPLRQYEDADTAWREVVGVRRALLLLRDARDLLTHAGARKAGRAVSRAIKSTEGAERHAERIYTTRYYDERRREGTA